MKVVEHEDYEGMYYLVWPDGTSSLDFYNLTRVKEHFNLLSDKDRGIAPRMPLRATEKPAGAFK